MKQTLDQVDMTECAKELQWKVKNVILLKFRLEKYFNISIIYVIFFFFFNVTRGLANYNIKYIIIPTIILK